MRPRRIPLRRHHAAADEVAAPAPAQAPAAVLDAAQVDQLRAVFAAPGWLRDLGRTAWALVGVALLVAGVAWVAGQAATIVEPVLAALVVATVAAPLVTLLQRHGVPRAAGALIGLLALVAIAAGVLLIVLGGIVAQAGAIETYANAAAVTLQSWIESAGVDESGASSARTELTEAVPQIISTLAGGVVSGIRGITSLAFALSFGAFALFFLLKDGPILRAWLNRHLGVPAPVADSVTGEVVSSVRRYFTGVTIVAAFNAVVVTLGAVVLDVPLAGTIGVVTFVTAYVPFIGAVVSGAFAVVMALGGSGTSAALIMLVIVILANGMLQNVVQPIAFGATLNLNPLLILVVTITAGSLVGMAGLVLAAPLTSAAVHIVRNVARMRAGPARDLDGPPEADGARDGMPALAP